jgi:hypothetical protein
MSSWNWHVNILCWLYLSSYHVPAAFKFRELKILLKINLDRDAGIHDNNLVIKSLISTKNLLGRPFQVDVIIHVQNPHLRNCCYFTFVFNYITNVVIFTFNPLHAELNPICQLLALLEAHHIFHVSGLRINYPMIFKYWATSGVQNKANYLNEIELYVNKHYAKKRHNKRKTTHFDTNYNAQFQVELYTFLSKCGAPRTKMLCLPICGIEVASARNYNSYRLHFI